MSDDPVEKSRLAWLGARYRFEKLVQGEPSDEEYLKARTDLERAKRRYDELVLRQSSIKR